MVVIGAFVRVDPSDIEGTRDRLRGLEGVETFDLDDAEKIGLLIEADDVDRGHAILTRQVRDTEGVWGAWPVYVHDEGDQEKARQAVNETV